MTTMKLGLCMQAIKTLTDSDAAKLSDAIEGYRKAGMEDRQSERAAIDDLIAQAEAEMAHLQKLADEQHAEQTESGAEPAISPTAAGKIADKVQARLGVGHSFSWRNLFDWADDAFGGTQAEGRYTPKDAYDALEMGVNRYILAHREITPNASAEAAEATVGRLGRMMELLPTQTKRTAEQDEFQQFSTVPPFAYVANWVAGLTANDTVLEPSAGIGGLAVFARNAGAKVIVNELSPRRAALLREVLPDARVFTENAEQIDNILPADVKPTAVVMNPPFSASAGRMQGARDTKIGARHLEQALDRLADGGRLVAIVGEGMALDRTAFRSWWKAMRAKYDVRAVVPVDGSGYAKYGTTFDNALIVIDKRSPVNGREIVTTKAEAYTDLVRILAEIRDDRASIESEPDEPPRAGAVHAGQVTAPVAGQPAAAQPAGVGAGASDGAGPVAAGGGRRRGETGRDQPGDAAGAPVGGERAGAGEDAAGSGETSAGVRGGSDSAADQPGLTPPEPPSGELTDSVFEQYRPQRLKVPGAKPHPGALVQSAAMASVMPPPPTYTPNLPRETITGGKLSVAQIEAVTYAGQAHEQMLPNGERRGFFIGDGTGVGKGREISGVLLDNLRQGRKRAVWVSEKQGLMNDAKRDFGGVGGDPAMIFNQNKTKAEDSIQATDGILFTTYSTLRSGSQKQVTKADGEAPAKKAGQSRLDQLAKWLGEDFDGVLVFDEAHNAGNAIAMKGERGFNKPSEQALAVVELQKRLPKARVLYVSATGATQVSNLSYATRLGLWGEGTPFPAVSNFINQMTAGGLATMELVARDMKQMGAYIARSLSFDGVTYARLEHDLTPLQRDIYNRMAEAWQVTLRNFMQALEITGAVDGETGKTKNGRALAAAKSAYWGAQQRFFNQIITSMQMPTVIEQMERDIADGAAVVAQLVNTNEAQQERALAKKRDEGDEELEDLDLTPRDQLIQMVQKSFPVVQMEDYIDEDGHKGTRPVLDSQGNPVENKQAVALRERLIRDLEQIKVPDGPLEVLINHFGPDVVAEVTGRGQRVVRKADRDGNVKAQIESRGAAAARADADAFMADKKRILVFSDAGGTGFSFHADRTKANQRKRQHYLLQPGWRADKAVQGMGRSHRTNQASEPNYRLAATDVPAHKRFLSAIARRLDMLGALTKGQRDTANQGLFSEKDNLESEYAQRAVRQLIDDVRRGQVGGVQSDEFLSQMGLEDIVDKETNQIAENKYPSIQQFLNRLLSLTLDMQHRVFDAFSARMDEAIELAAARGELDAGMETIRALSSRVVNEDVAYTDPRTGAETNLVELDLTQPTRMYPFPNERTQGGKIEWLVNAKSGRVWGRVLSGTATLRSGAVVDRYRMLSTGGTQSKTAEDFKDADAYRAIDAKEARELWDKETAARPKTYTETKHMIVGALLPIWDRINAGGGTLRVVRTQTSDGRRLLGRMVSDKDLPEVRKRLNVASPLAKLDPATVLGRILDGQTAELANGWQLERVRVSGQPRVEVKAGYLSGPAAREITGMGVVMERISWAERYFVPTGPAGAATLQRLLASKPLVGLKKDGEEDAPAFSRSTGLGIDMRDAQAVAAQIRQAMPNAPQIVLHESVDKAPKRLQQHIDQAGARNDVEAIYHDGEIHAFPQHFSSIERAQFVLGHHEIRHHGIAGLIPNASMRSALLLSMYQGNAALRSAAQAKIDAGHATSRVVAVEEALADMPVEQIEKLSGFAKLVSALRRGLRELASRLRRSGLSSLADAIEPSEWSDNDVAAFVLKAESFSRSSGGPAMFSRSEHDGEALQRATLQALSDNDELFKLPRLAGRTVSELAFELDPTIKVTRLPAEGLRQRWRVTLPDGGYGDITIRKPNPHGPDIYGFDLSDGEMVNVVTERPGENTESVDGSDDVWIDMSQMKTGQGGDRIYAIAGALAHNTGRIFIGDPNGLSDIALRRRAENMASLAMRYGTTEFLGPHPDQIKGSKELGVPPLRWVYGDDHGNLERLIALNVKAVENAFPEIAKLDFDVTTGQFVNAVSGARIDRDRLAGRVAERRKEEGSGGALGRAAAAGRTVARAVVLRSLSRQEGGQGQRSGGRASVLDRLGAAASGPGRSGLSALFSRAPKSGVAHTLAGIRNAQLPAGRIVNDFIASHGKLSWWHKTVGTMHNLAERSPQFKRVYDSAQSFLNDVSLFATEAADLAPRLLPKLESVRDVWKSPLSAQDTKAIAAPIFEGTLSWVRDADGKPVRIEDLEKRAAEMDVHDKAHELLQAGKVAPNVLRMWQGLPIEQYEPLIHGKYEREMLQPGVVWTDDELQSIFRMSKDQIGLYREFRAATDRSLTQLAISDMVRFAGKDIDPQLRDEVLAMTDARQAALALRDRLFELAEEEPERSEVLNDAGNTVIGKGDRAADLMDRGYAPLSRYGHYTLDVIDQSGERVYFGLFESEADANRMARQLAKEYPQAKAVQGTLSDKAYQMFSGVSPETLELFGDMLGLESQGNAASDVAFQKYLQLAKANRSALKRLIHRKGIAGFSEDAGRVLAGFVYSNARQASKNLHFGEMTKATQDIAEDKSKGELLDAAVELHDYITNPREEAQKIRGLMFTQFLGGSIAAGMVNLTQPVMVTFPYLSQFGGVAKAAKQMSAAVRGALAWETGKHTTGDAKLDAAMKRAEEEGIVSPQEVHSLIAQANGAGALKAGDGTKLGDAAAKASNFKSKIMLLWGKPFAVTEQFNRRATFIAAYRTAVEQGVDDPASFAEKAVVDTQFSYTRANRPRWARGAIGATLFTFKQYSISYVELMTRMAKSGPEGRKAALVGLATLFLLAGLQGMPGADDLDDLIDGALQRMGYNFSSKMAKREFLASVLGDGGAMVVMRGLSGLPGVPLDVSGRLGLGNLVPGTGFLTKKADHSSDALELLGPAGSFAKQVGTAAGKLAEGEIIDAARAVLPLAASNAVKAADMASTGMYRDERGRKVIDTDGIDAAFKAIGFRPNDVARVQKATSEVQQIVALTKLRETEIADKWARGVFEHDQSLVQEARDELARWNESNADARIKIDAAQILKRTREMRLSKEERIAKTAPKEMRATVRRELEAASQ